MELNEKGYPIYKDSGTFVHRDYAYKYLLNRERKLRPGEQVHHVDGDKLNLNPNNLVILSKGDHQKITSRLIKEHNLKVVRRHFLVGISAAHLQEMFNGDLLFPRICDLVGELGKEIDHLEVDALQTPTIQCDPYECRGETLGR